MSFRSRLTTFFILIVVVPMAAMAFLVFRLIDDSQAGKADARASAVASAASSIYQHASLQASVQARTVARDLTAVPAGRLRSRAGQLAGQLGLARVTIQGGSGPPVDVGNRTAVAPGMALVTGASGRPVRTITVSQLTAGQFARALAGPGIQAVVRSEGTTLASTLPAAEGHPLPARRGSVTIGSGGYRVQQITLSGFGGGRVQAWILADVGYGGSVLGDRLLAAAFLVGFLVLAFFFSLLASRALQSQLSRFLDAARRLAGGDFSSPVPTTGRDEFALLGEEFNTMSRQLERRLAELGEERSRVRASIRRIGEAFASGLDREALVALALRTAMDATRAAGGRVTTRDGVADALAEAARDGSLGRLEDAVAEAERRAIAQDGCGQAVTGQVHVASVALGPIVPDGLAHGLITVCRRDRFSEDDMDLLRTLAAQTTLALANVNLHHDIQRQAVTDDLTGLATHGRFQELLGAEMEEVRRYRYPVGLVMLDIDNFKSINDRYGHQQGDMVLRAVGEVLRGTTRDVDVAARYGGEELALILPHTDLSGAYELAERARSAIEALRIPLLGGSGTLRITASAGAASSSEGDQDELIAAADGALYVAKRDGRNRTVKAASHPVNVVGGE